MLPFFRPRNEKDIGDTLVGKRRKYRLARNGSAVALTGTLLAYYRRDVQPDGLMPPAGGRVELFAVIRTQAGRFFCYYIVTYPETEDIAGRQEYAHVCPDFDAVGEFLGAMAYPNRAKFAEAVLAAAAKTLDALEPARRKAAQAVAVPGTPADLPPGAPADVPPDAPADAPPAAPADTPPDAPADVPAGVPPHAPAGVPADVPPDAPADVPLDAPADVPPDAPADTPPDAPADVPPPSDVPVGAFLPTKETDRKPPRITA